MIFQVKYRDSHNATCFITFKAFDEHEARNFLINEKDCKEILDWKVR